MTCSVMEESFIAPATAEIARTRAGQPRRTAALTGCCCTRTTLELPLKTGDDRPSLSETRRRKRRRATPTVAVTALLALLVVGLPWTWNCHGITGATAASTSSSNSWGTNFVLTRLDHTEAAYCQGQLFLVLVNPDPRQSASVQITSSQKLHQVTVPPSDQLMYEDVDCPSLLDENHDEIPDAAQYDTTTPENVTRILPSFRFIVQIQSNLPIQAYATTRNSMSNPQDDRALLIPTDAWGSTYRLLDFASTLVAPSPSSSSNNRVGETRRSEGSTDDGNDDGGGSDDSMSAPRHNRTRYTAFGIVALNTDGNSGRSTTTSVYLRNDVTGQESATYQLQSGQVFWYRSPTLITTAAPVAPASTDLAPTTTTPRRQEPGPKADDMYRIRPRPQVDDATGDDGRYADDGSTMDDHGSPGDSSYNSTSTKLYDITGWHVVASQPVAVFVASYGEDEVPSIAGIGRRHLKRRSVRFQSFQQLVPETALGSTYMVCPIAAVPAEQGTSGSVTCNSDRGGRFEASCQDPLNRIRYIATRNQTDITLLFPGSDGDSTDDDGSAPTPVTQRVRLESAGQYYDLETTQPHHVMSNFPLYVYQSLVESDKEGVGGDADSDLRSSSIFYVPSMDQLLRPQPVSSADGPPLRVAVQHDQSTLRILHARSNQITLNDKWVGNDDGMLDDRLYQNRRRQRPCRSAGTWMGIEYCCTQLNKVSAGMYTIAAGPPGQDSTEEPNPIGISVMTVSGAGSVESVVPKPPKGGQVLAHFFDPGTSGTPDQGDGGSSSVTSRPADESPPTPSPSHGSPRDDDSVATAPADSTRRVSSYSGGIAVQEVLATCTTGGPYQKRVFHFPSPNFQLSGEAMCLNDVLPALVMWNSSDSSNVAFSNPMGINTKVRFLQPGLYTLCLAVNCQDASPVTCCATFEAIQDGCDAGGPYRVDSTASGLPAATTLKGTVASCEDGTSPVVSWFHNATDNDPRKNDITFDHPDELDGRVSASSFGAFDICLTASCGTSDLLQYQCCAKLRVRELSTVAGSLKEEEPTRSEPAPSDVIQPSPTSSSSPNSAAGRPSRHPSIVPVRENEGRRPVASNAPVTNSSSSGGQDVVHNYPLRDRTDPHSSTVGLATQPGLPSSDAPTRSPGHVNDLQGGTPMEPTKSSRTGDGNRKRKSGGGGGGGGGVGGGGGGGGGQKHGTGDRRPGRDHHHGDGTNQDKKKKNTKKKDRGSSYFAETLRNIFFRGS